MPIPRMKRGEFVAALGGAAAWPLVARAQQASKIYRIGIVSAGPVPPSKIQSAFFDGLRDLGWIEGKNIAFEQRYADNHLEPPTKSSNEVQAATRPADDARRATCPISSSSAKRSNIIHLAGSMRRLVSTR